MKFLWIFYEIFMKFYEITRPNYFCLDNKDICKWILGKI